VIPLFTNEFEIDKAKETARTEKLALTSDLRTKSRRSGLGLSGCATKGRRFPDRFELKLTTPKVIHPDII